MERRHTSPGRRAKGHLETSLSLGRPWLARGQEMQAPPIGPATVRGGLVAWNKTLR